MEVAIAAGDGLHICGDREGDEVVILRIARDCGWIDDVGMPLTESTHLLLERCSGARLHILGQFRPAKHVDDLFYQLVGHDRDDRAVVDELMIGPSAPLGVIVDEMNTLGSTMTRCGGASLTRAD